MYVVYARGFAARALSTSITSRTDGSPRSQTASMISPSRSCNGGGTYRFADIRSIVVRRLDVVTQQAQSDRRPADRERREHDHAGLAGQQGGVERGVDERLAAHLPDREAQRDQ